MVSIYDFLTGKITARQKEKMEGRAEDRVKEKRGVEKKRRRRRIRTKGTRQINFKVVKKTGWATQQTSQADKNAGRGCAAPPGTDAPN
jgi:hypothetical protein